jgi:hypothetical protein
MSPISARSAASRSQWPEYSLWYLIGESPDSKITTLDGAGEIAAIVEASPAIEGLAADAEMSAG